MATGLTMDIDAFADCLLGDIFGSLLEIAGVSLEMPEKRTIKRGNLPGNFHVGVMKLSHFFVMELKRQASQMPNLLFYSEELFRKFADRVCDKLIADVEPELAFLKAMIFLILFIVLSFLQKCYHPLDLMPAILRKLLQEKIQTRFYLDGEFEGVQLKTEQLQVDKKWCETTLQEMRTYMDEVLQEELPAARDFDQPDRKLIKIAEVKLHADKLRSDATNCPYCDTRCFILLKAFYKPTVVYKPEHPFYQQMDWD